MLPKHLIEISTRNKKSKKICEHVQNTSLGIEPGTLIHPHSPNTLSIKLPNNL